MSAIATPRMAIRCPMVPTRPATATPAVHVIFWLDHTWRRASRARQGGCSRGPAIDSPVMRFEVCEPGVVHETIDGEVVAINLETGAYYSLRDSAAAIWAGVERAAPVDKVVAAVEAGFDGEGISAEARRFLG